MMHPLHISLDPFNMYPEKILAMQSCSVLKFLWVYYRQGPKSTITYCHLVGFFCFLFCFVLLLEGIQPYAHI